MCRRNHSPIYNTQYVSYRSFLTFFFFFFSFFLIFFFATMKNKIKKSMYVLSLIWQRIIQYNYFSTVFRIHVFSIQAYCIVQQMCSKWENIGKSKRSSQHVTRRNFSGLTRGLPIGQHVSRSLLNWNDFHDYRLNGQYTIEALSVRHFQSMSEYQNLFKLTFRMNINV